MTKWSSNLGICTTKHSCTRLPTSHTQQTDKQASAGFNTDHLAATVSMLSVLKLHHRVLLLDWILELKNMNRTVPICPQCWKFIILRVTGNLPGVPSAKTRTCQAGLN